MAPSFDSFVVPLFDKHLVYAPLRKLVALVDRRALEQIRLGLQFDVEGISEAIRSIVEQLRSPSAAAPKARTGPLSDPLFLGIIPTRGCNMGCRYCDFTAPKNSSPVMDLSIARAAVNSYLKLLHECGQNHAEIHFFGGEPFFAEEVVHFTVAYASMRAEALGLTTSFEVTTNGMFSDSRCRWIADHFDTVVLSLDGPADIQNYHRPALRGHDSFDVVSRSARILSEGSTELIIRTCVTRKTTEILPEIARWIAQEFRPKAVCFESLVPSALSLAAGLEPPDPWVFARCFNLASRMLAAHGIEAILSTGDLSDCRASLCPVGKDALIVSPHGFVDACYLLEDQWRQKGLDMRLGRVDPSRQVMEIDDKALQRVRRLNVDNKPLCANCFCRYHCAGGCHVSHDTSAQPGQFDDLCVQSRLVTTANLLTRLGLDGLVDSWFADPDALRASVFRDNDRLVQAEVVA